MRRELLAGTLLAIVVGVWDGPRLPAQEQTAERPKRVLLIDQIDELGRTIFDGILSPFQHDARREPAEDSRPWPTRYANRSSMVRVPRGEPSTAATDQGTGGPPSASMGQGHTLPSRLIDSDRQSPPPAQSKLAPYAHSYPPEVELGAIAEDKPAAPVGSFPSAAGGGAAESPGPASSSQPVDPASRRLHERLTLVRESAFGDAADPVVDPGVPAAVVESQSIPRQSDAVAEEPAAEALVESRPSGAGGAVAVSDADVAAGSRQVEISDGEPPAEPNSFAAESNAFADVSAVSPRPTRVEPEGSAFAGISPKAIANDDVLIIRQSHVLNGRTLGTRRITDGKPATFVVSIANSGRAAADQVVVTIGLPEWADVVGTEATAGTAGWAASSGNSRQFQWLIDRLAANSEEELTLKVVPLKSQPFDLAVNWDYKPASSQALIEVQEPKLEIRLDGPREILFGSQQVYRLELKNTGTGDAENVEISLMPIGVGNRKPATHTVGALEAGATKAVELELTARQAGELTVEVEVRGDAAAQAKLVEKIVVLRPALTVRIDAPSVQYAGTVANYKIRVGNPGTAVARNVKVSAAVPPGARHGSSSPAVVIEPGRNELTWKLDSLAPGAEETFLLRCILEQPGQRLLSVRSAADGDVSAEADAATLVQTIPDLVLDVRRPVGPVPVGAEATYEVAIRNRGSQTAEGVEVVSYFSRGVEPTSAKGAEYKIGPGQVVFQRIPSLGVGEDLNLVILAKAETSGNHVLRVEVYCKTSGIRLVSEEMTHFYGDGLAPEGERGPQHAELKAAEPAKEVLRTAERP